jgi:hypothetical protein
MLVQLSGSNYGIQRALYMRVERTDRRSPGVGCSLEVCMINGQSPRRDKAWSISLGLFFSLKTETNLKLIL